MSNPVIYLDMDGVVADFAGGALKVHGKWIEPADVPWDFCSVIGFNGPGDPAFWAPLSNTDFWANLDPLPDGMALYERVRREFPDVPVAVLSSSAAPGSSDGKRAWLRKHLPELEKSALFGTVKWLAAAPCKVLIDDHEPNVDAFVGKRGRAVLAPRPWNRRRGETCPLGRFDPDPLVADLRAILNDQSRGGDK